MTLFRQLAAAARSAHAHYFGTTGTVTFTAYPGAVAKKVTAILGRETVETRREDNRDVRYLVRECRFTTLDAVRHDAIVTVDGINYSIDHTADRQASGITVKLQRTTLTEANRPNYRGKG